MLAAERALLRIVTTCCGALSATLVSRAFFPLLGGRGVPAIALYIILVHVFCCSFLPLVLRAMVVP